MHSFGPAGCAISHCRSALHGMGSRRGQHGGRRLDRDRDRRQLLERLALMDINPRLMIAKNRSKNTGSQRFPDKLGKDGTHRSAHRKSSAKASFSMDWLILPKAISNKRCTPKFNNWVLGTMREERAWAVVKQCEGFEINDKGVIERGGNLLFTTKTEWYGISTLRKDYITERFTWTTRQPGGLWRSWFAMLEWRNSFLHGESGQKHT